MSKLIIAAAALLVAGAAHAQPTEGGATVGPARIPGETREQKLAAVTKALRAMDSNGDERITSAEWTAAGGKRPGFDTLDYNRDDVLTWQELRSNARKLKAFKDFQAAAPY